MSVALTMLKIPYVISKGKKRFNLGFKNITQEQYLTLLISIIWKAPDGSRHLIVAQQDTMLNISHVYEQFFPWV